MRNSKEKHKKPIPHGGRRGFRRRRRRRSWGEEELAGACKAWSGRRRKVPRGVAVARQLLLRLRLLQPGTDPHTENPLIVHLYFLRACSEAPRFARRGGFWARSFSLWSAQGGFRVYVCEHSTDPPGQWIFVTILWRIRLTFLISLCLFFFFWIW